MDILQISLITLATGLMVVALLLAFIPVLPGPVLVWGVAIAFGYLNGFQRFTTISAILVTALMIGGVTNDFWLPLLGARTMGLSWQASVGSFIGGFIGTFFLPIPVIGTLVGCVAGALILELARLRQMRGALQAGQSALKMFILSYIVEIAASVAIFAVYMVSILSTG
jgi:hypothetical protein